MIKHYVKLDVSKRSERKIIPVSFCDERAHTIIFSLTNGADPIILPACAAVFVNVRNEGSPIEDKNVFINEENNTVEYTPTAAAFSSCGTVACILVIADSDGRRLYSPTFCLYVEEAGGDISKVFDEAATMSAAGTHLAAIMKTAINYLGAEGDNVQKHAEAAEEAKNAAEASAKEISDLSKAVFDIEAKYNKVSHEDNKVTHEVTLKLKGVTGETVKEVTLPLDHVVVGINDYTDAEGKRYLELTLPNGESTSVPLDEVFENLIIPVDKSLNESSENPVQNAVVTENLKNKIPKATELYPLGTDVYPTLGYFKPVLYSPVNNSSFLISLGCGTRSGGVEMPSNKLMLTRYQNDGSLVCNDGTGDYSAVNNRVLAEKLSALKTELEKELSDIETVLNTLVKYEWLDLFPDNENAQVIVNNAKKYHFRGYADSTWETAIVSDSFGNESVAALVQEAFVSTDVDFIFTLDSIPNLEQGGSASGKLTEFSIPEGAWWDDNVVINSCEGVGVAVSMTRNYDAENDVYYVDIYATVRFNINVGIHSEQVNADYTLDVTIYRDYYNEADKFTFTKAYVAVNNDTMDYFPSTMSLRQQSINNQIIASLEAAKARRAAARAASETEE